MFSREHILSAFSAAVPIMLGYVAIGLPCGILGNTIGLNPLQVALLSILLYSGAGQFMIPNMFLAGSSVAAITASVSLVNTRQMLYAASFAPQCAESPRWLSALFAASVTDESYGVNTARFAEGNWSVDRALMVNLFSQSSWTISNIVGCAVGAAVDIPVPIAAFAMTAIFICLLVTQKFTSANIVAMIVAMLGVYLCKAFGLTGPAILIGAVAGVVCALAFSALFPRKKGGPKSGPTEGGAQAGCRASSSSGPRGFAPTEGGAQAGATPVGVDLGRPSSSGDTSPDEGGERR